jgi:hypothetical protein
VVRERRESKTRRGRIKARDKIDPLLYINPLSNTYPNIIGVTPVIYIYKGKNGKAVT